MAGFATVRTPQSYDPQTVPEKVRDGCCGLTASETHQPRFWLKATAFVKDLGIDDVFHLRGGILKYLETVDAADSLWRGECFVFDRRVAVGHGLAPGTHTLCHGCREPLSPEDLRSPLYVEGVSCPHCHDDRSADQQARYAERQRQEALAMRRGERHVGRRDGEA